MESQMIRKIGAYAAGAVVGGIAGYFLGKAIVDYMHEKELDKEIEEALARHPQDFDEVVPAENSDSNKPVIYKNEQINGKINYATYGDKDRQDLNALASKYKANRQEEDEIPVGPYVISIESYSEEHPEYDKISITYYQMDATYADPNEEIVDDPDTRFGAKIHEHFGEKSGDADIVYVRSNNSGTDYEIIRVKRSYAEDVLGEMNDTKKAPKDEKPKRGRKGKMKNEEDEPEGS